MNRLLPAVVHRPLIPPPTPVVQAVGRQGVGEVTRSTSTAHCHHRAGCLTPLQVGDLVFADRDGWSLLEHRTEARACG